MIDPLKVKAITKEANAYMEKKGYLYRLNKDDVEIVLEAAERIKRKCKTKSSWRKQWSDLLNKEQK